MRSFRMITAYSSPSMGLGCDNKMVWHIPADLKQFNNKTTTGVPDVSSYVMGLKKLDSILLPVVVMGRKTWDSLPSRTLPKLKDRMNIVITNNKDLYEISDPVEKMTVFCSFENLELILNMIEDNISPRAMGVPYIIGGGQLYKLALDHLNIERVDVTEVYSSIKCDSFFPCDLMSDPKFKILNVSKFYKHGDLFYRYINFSKTFVSFWRNEEETSYLQLMKEIVTSSPEPRLDRTGVGTYSVFGKHLSYDLSDTFPISTTRAMYLRGIFEELMMYLRGKTDNKILNKKGVHVWDGNTTREFLDGRSLNHYDVGDMGSTYGFNFRHFGASYNGCDEDYTGQGYDQLQEVISLLKFNPESRRIIINLWDPAANKGAALPACMCMYQFYVRKDTTGASFLDLQVYIRSNDYFLANNWNTCTGALFVHLLCSLNGLTYLTPGKLTVCIGDTHVYAFHKEQAMTNISRVPFPFPKLVVKTTKENIEDFEFDDIKLLGYKHHPRITAPMAV
jgi:thymidylate synthase